jgi:hypothetical protein
MNIRLPAILGFTRVGRLEKCMSPLDMFTFPTKTCLFVKVLTFYDLGHVNVDIAI